MQTVWSRAAQARCLCNCPTCISVTAATARRTTTVTARRGVRRGDVYTVFASSLAATAAFADSRNKDARSEQWERVISEVRAQVQAKEEEHQHRLAALSPHEWAKTTCASDRDDFRKTIRETVQRFWRRVQSHNYADSWPHVFRWAAQHQEARAAAGFQDWKGPSLTLLQSLSPAQLQKLLTDDLLLRRFYGGPNCAALDDAVAKEIRSIKKVRTLEWSIAKLVLKLLYYSKTELAVPVTSHSPDDIPPIVTTPRGVTQQNDISQVTGQTSLERRISDRKTDSRDSTHKSEEPQHLMQGQSIKERLAQIDEKISSLHSGGPEKIIDANSQFYRDFESPPLLRFRGSSAMRNEEAAALHKSLGMLIHQSQYTDRMDLMSKIGYNLLTSDIAPNVHTYNMLLVHFCHADSYAMFRAVMTSMRESHIRPNELTHATVLRYFTITDRGNFFIQYVLRMEGHLQGLALEDPNKNIPPITSQRYHTFFNGLGRKKIAEKARMNGEVYEALIVGALRFLGPHSAMQYYRDMISEGWQASVDLLVAILKSCYRSCDWNAGVSVWDQIIAIPERANRRAFEWMLCLCQACGQQVAFEQVLQSGVEAGTLSPTLLSLADHVKQQKSDTSQEDVEKYQSLPVLFGTPATAPVSWIEKHIENSIAAGAMKKSEEHVSENGENCLALVVPEGPANLLPVPWGFAESSGTESESSNEEFQPAQGDGQLARPLSTPTGTYDDTVKFRVLDDLAAKIKNFNGKDIHKMNHREYIDYRYKLKYKHEKKGPVASRGVFEIFKTIANLRLDKDDQQGRLYGEPSPFTSLELKHYAPEPGSLSSDTQHTLDYSN